MTEGKLPEEMNTPEVRPWVECLGRQRGRLVRKRLFDIGASLMILLIASPFLLLLALAIKLDSPGPVFYRQVRVGRYGKDFRIFKFRTMVQDADKKGLSLTFSRLPPTLEALISDCNIIGNGPTLDALCAGIRPLHLKNLNLQCCSLNNSSFERLVQAFPSELEFLNLGNNPNVTDRGAELLLAHIKRPDVLIRRLEFDGMLGVSKGLRKELQEAADDNNDRYMQKLQQQKAAQIAKTKEGARVREAVGRASRDDIKGLLHDALRHGAADAAFETMKKTGASLTLKDALQTNAEGKTLLEACREAGKLPQLIAPEMFGNVKDFNEVYDALSEKGKRIYDGKDGRPSVQQVKNRIMSAAVKRAVSQRSEQRG